MNAVKCRVWELQKYSFGASQTVNSSSHHCTFPTDFDSQHTTVNSQLHQQTRSNTTACQHVEHQLQVRPLSGGEVRTASSGTDRPRIHGVLGVHPPPYHTSLPSCTGARTPIPSKMGQEGDGIRRLQTLPDDSRAG